jgi:subtilase family serine protease
MNDKTGGNRGPRRAAALAVAAAVAVLTTACSVVHVHFGSSGGPGPTRSATYRAELAYAQCMRAHGVQGFPDPNPSGGPGSNAHMKLNPNGPAGQANHACQHLLAVGGTGGAAAPERASSPGALVADCLTSQPPSCDTPQQLRVAYGIQPLLDRGITGREQTVVLLEFPPASAVAGAQVPAVSDIRQDLARFDSTFGLPAARLQVMNTLAHVTSPWLAAAEEVGDTEIVHAIAPDAAIREVLIPSPYTASIGKVSPAVVAALQLGLAQGGVIELSAGVGEQCFTPAEVAQWNSVLQAAQRNRVTVVISTGDNGAGITPCPGGTTSVKGVDFPASDPLTLAVGGTSLHASRTSGAYLNETAWNVPSSARGAGGGGFSVLFPRPAYQDGIAGVGATRGVPDVAADADYRTGLAIAFSSGGHDYLMGGGGVSAAAPLWAAVIALADQYAGRTLGFVNPALCQIGRSAYYHQAFHDVTTGTNTMTFPTPTITGYHAAPGSDPVTGWGSPNAHVLVPLLARYVSP